MKKQNSIVIAVVVVLVLAVGIWYFAANRPVSLSSIPVPTSTVSAITGTVGAPTGTGSTGVTGTSSIIATITPGTGAGASFVISTTSLFLAAPQLSKIVYISNGGGSSSLLTWNASVGQCMLNNVAYGCGWMGLSGSGSRPGGVPGGMASPMSVIITQTGLPLGTFQATIGFHATATDPNGGHAHSITVPPLTVTFNKTQLNCPADGTAACAHK